MKKIILSLSLFILGWADPLSAEIMTYQGRLKESNVPVNANRVFVFKFCDAETLGNCYTTPSGFQSFTVQNGLFKSTFSVPTSDLSQGAWYLQVSVGVDVPTIQDLSPRERLTAVPYSVYSSTAGYSPAALQKAGDTMTGQFTSISSVTIIGNGGVYGLQVSSNVSLAGALYSANGKVGIGIAVPQFPLTVYGNPSGNIINVGDLATPGGNTAGLGLDDFNAFPGAALYVNNAKVFNVESNGGAVIGSTYMTADAVRNGLIVQGNVGIGTAVPNYTLEISSGAGEAGTIMSVSTGATNLFWVAGDGAHSVKFSGDGSGLTGVTGASGTDSSKVMKTGDTMTGGLTLAGSTLTVTGDAFSVGSSTLVVVNGNVGVGTASPDQKLTVAGNISQTGVLISSGAGNNYFAGKVGIGTAGPNFVLEVVNTNGNAGMFQSSGVNDAWLYLRSDPVKQSGLVLGDTSPGNLWFLMTEPDDRFSIAYGAITGQKLTLDTAGNVGIGTTSPGAKLDVAGSGNFSGGVTTLSSGTFKATGPNQFSVETSSGILVQGGRIQAPAIQLTNGAAANYVLASDAVGNAAWVNPAAGGVGDGWVGNEITDTADATLTKSGSGIAVDPYKIALNLANPNTWTAGQTFNSGLAGGLTGAASLNVLKNGDTMTGPLTLAGSTLTVTGSEFSVGGSTLVVTNGRVGIGTNSPAANLHVISDTGYVHFASPNGSLTMNMVPQSFFPVIFNNNGAGSFAFNIGNDEQMRINPQTMVGIGTNNPFYRLHISSGAGESGVIMAVSTGTSVVFGVKGNGEVSAGKYFGDGSALTGVTGSDATKLPLAGGTLTGQLTLSGSSLTVAGEVLAARYLIGGSTVLAILPGSASLGVGVNAGRMNSGNGNSFVGTNSGWFNTTGQNNSFLGFYTGTNNTTGSYNSYSGAYAGYTATTGGANSFLGYEAGYNNNGDYNSFVGYDAGYHNLSGTNNTIMGNLAGYNNETGSFNAIFGNEAGNGVSGGSFSQSTLVGDKAGTALTTGSGNVLLGYRAGDSLQTGGNNIVIGSDQDASSPAAFSELNIGGLLYGNLTAKTIGISTRVPQAALDIVSTGTAQTQFAQVWRDSGGVIRSSVSATGVLMAGKFVGDGSGLTGVSGADATKLPLAGGTMTGQLTLANSTLTVTGNAFSVAGSTLVVSAGKVGIGTFAPAYQLDVMETIRTSSLPGSNGRILLGDGDIAHGMTGLVPTTDTIGLVTANSGTGGLHVGGFSSGAGATGLHLGGTIGSTDPTDTVPAVQIDGAKQNGISWQPLASSETILGVRNNGGANLLTVLGNGNVGIGAAVPSTQLEISGTASGFTQTRANGAFADAPDHVFKKARGSVSTPLIVASGDNLGNISYLGYDGGGYQPAAWILSKVDGAPGPGDMPGRLEFHTTPDGAASSLERMRISNSGNVGIATASPVGLFQVGGGSLTVLASGNVGVGTASPDTPLQVYGGTGNLLKLQSSATMGTAGQVIRIPFVQVSNTEVGRIEAYTEASGKIGLGFYTYNSGLSANANLYIQSNGNVGIATASPAGLFQVGGGSLTVLSSGYVGLGTITPQARLDVFSTGSTQADMAAIWRNSAGIVVSSVSATGVVMAGKFIGDGSGLTSVSATDVSKLPLAGGTLAGNLTMGGNNIYSASTITASGDITAARYQINGSTVLAILPGVGSLGVGYLAGRANTADGNSFIGYLAGYNNTTGASNSFLGHYSGFTNTGGLNNAFLGYRSGYNNSTGRENSFLGYFAGFTNTTGRENSFIGANAGYLNTTGRSNSFIGFNTGNYNTTGDNNSFLGANAGFYTQTGSGDVVVGYQAGGYGAAAANSFSSSTVVGYQAGYNLSGGSADNTFLGWQAGYNVTTGTGNIVIGYDQRTPAAASNSFLNIGGLLYGDLSAKTIGISTRAPQAALDVLTSNALPNSAVQIWRRSDGLAVATVTALGIFQGDGSGLTNVTVANGVYTTAANTFTNTSAPVLIKPSVAPAADTKLLDMQLTGAGVTNFSVDSEGDVATTGGMLVLKTDNASTSRLTLETDNNANNIMELSKYGSSAGGSVAGGTILLANMSRVAAGATGGPLLLHVVTNNPMHFVTNDVERMRIATGGNVGIATASPAGLFQVGGGSLTVMASGNVGVGTASPSTRLSVRDNSPVNVTEVLTVGNKEGQSLNTGATPTIGIRSYNQPLVSIGGYVENAITPPPSSFIVQTNNGVGLTEKLRVTSAGRVGVGRNDPQYAIDVSTVNAADGYIARFGDNGIIISTGGAIQTTGFGHGTFIGNARGNAAVDLQAARAAATHVASGDFSVISGGLGNSSAGPYSNVGGGYYNSASGSNGTVGGGQYNRATQSMAAVSGGYLNYAQGTYSAIPGGYMNLAVGSRSFAAGHKSSSTADGTFTWASGITGGENYTINETPGRAWFNVKGGFLVTASTNPTISGLVDRGLLVTNSGLVGISTGSPQAALDLVSTGAAVNIYAQIWRDSTGLVVASMTSTGRLSGDGSGLTGLSDPSKLPLSGGTMAGDLYMGGNNIYAASSVTASGSMSAGRYLINGSTALAILPGSMSLGIGVNAGRVNTGIYNVFVGSGAGYSNTSGGQNVFMGKDAGYLNTVGAANTFVGMEAGHQTTAGFNAFFGTQAGYNTGTGTKNSFLGTYAGLDNVSGSYNSLVGYQASQYNVAGGSNTVMGYNAGNGTLASSYEGNTVMGYQAGYGMSTGSNNILIGLQAGYSLDTGSKNIIIGYNEEASSLSASNELNIGGLLFGNLSAKTIGISTRAPQAALDVLTSNALPNSAVQIWRRSDGLAVATVTALGIFQGDGSGLTNITAPNSVAKAGDTMTGQLTLQNSSLTIVSAGALPDFRLTRGGVFNWDIGGNSGVYLNFVYNATPVVTFDTGGQVGIGTSSPGSALEVSGGSVTIHGRSIHPYVLMAGDNGVVISTGGAIQTTGRGHGSIVGNLRGVGAVDLQTYRTAASQVASGLYAVVSGGYGNTATNYAFAGGGYTNLASGGFSVVGGGQSNQSSNGWTTVGGGNNNIASQNYATVGGGSGNTVSSYSGTVAGGYINNVISSAYAGFIGGGESNISTGAYSTVGGGQLNTSSGAFSAVLGGYRNVADGAYSGVAGGSSNRAYGVNSAVTGGNLNSAWGNFSTVSGGNNNSTTGLYSMIAGGDFNSAGGQGSAVVGGNLNNASGTSSFIGGGGSNEAKGWGAVVFGGNNAAMGGFSFAAGYRSTSAYDGSFTWSDSQGLEVVNNVQDQVMFKAKGGFWVSTGTVYANPALYIDASNNIGIGTAYPTAKLHLANAGDGIRFPDGTLMTTAGVGSANSVANITNAIINGDSDGNTTGSVILQTAAQDRVYVSTSGNVGIGTSVPQAMLEVSGTARLSRYMVEPRDTGGTMSIADSGKTITVNSASPQAIALPVGTAGTVGAQFTFVKLGTGKLTINAGATDFIADSTMAGNIYNDAVSPPFATITLRLVTSTKWMLVGGEGAWVTQ